MAELSEDVKMLKLFLVVFMLKSKADLSKSGRCMLSDVNHLVILLTLLLLSVLYGV